MSCNLLAVRQEIFALLTRPTASSLACELREPQAIYSIYLKQCTFTQDLLQELKSSEFAIKELKIEEYDGTLDLSYMPYLETLEISSTTMTSTPCIAGCRALKSYTLATQSCIKGPYFEDFPHLESIDLSGCVFLYTAPVVIGCPSLTKRLDKVNERAHPPFNFVGDG